MKTIFLLATRYSLLAIRTSTSALVAIVRRRRHPLRAAIRTGTPVVLRPPVSDRLLFLDGARVGSAAPILARAPAGMRTFVIIAHRFSPGNLLLIPGLDERGVKALFERGRRALRQPSRAEMAKRTRSGSRAIPSAIFRAAARSSALAPCATLGS